MFLTKSKTTTKTNQRGGNLVVMTVSRAANYGLHGLHTRKKNCLLPFVYLPTSLAASLVALPTTVPYLLYLPTVPYHLYLPTFNHVKLPILSRQGRCAQLIWFSTTFWNAVTCAWVSPYPGCSRRWIGVIHRVGIGQGCG